MRRRIKEIEEARMLAFKIERQTTTREYEGRSYEIVGVPDEVSAAALTRLWNRTRALAAGHHPGRDCFTFGELCEVDMNCR